MKLRELKTYKVTESEQKNKKKLRCEAVIRDGQEKRVKPEGCKIQGAATRTEEEGVSRKKKIGTKRKETAWLDLYGTHQPDYKPQKEKKELMGKSPTRDIPQKRKREGESMDLPWDPFPEGEKKRDEGKNFHMDQEATNKNRMAEGTP